jgi:hypothetical protein
MATFVIFDDFMLNLGEKLIDLNGDTLKWALTNSAPVADTGDALADITQIANGNGYTTGGTALTGVTWAETSAGSGVWRLSAADTVFTAAGGSIGPFRYAVLYDDTPTTPIVDPLIGYLDYGSAITVPDGGTFTIDIGASGILTATVP